MQSHKIEQDENSPKFGFWFAGHNPNFSISYKVLSPSLEVHAEEMLWRKSFAENCGIWLLLIQMVVNKVLCNDITISIMSLVDNFDVSQGLRENLFSARVIMAIIMKSLHNMLSKGYLTIK